MSTMNQRQGVYLATMNVLAESDKNWDDGVVHIDTVITESEKATVIAVVTAGFLSGEITMGSEARAKYSDEKNMRGYVKGLVNNWYCKDLRLTGNTAWVAKNPGSRAGCGDGQLKALKTLRVTKSDDAAALAAIDQAIAARKAELGQATKVELTEEQVALIPEHLRALLKI